MPHVIRGHERGGSPVKYIPSLGQNYGSSVGSSTVDITNRSTDGAQCAIVQSQLEEDIACRSSNLEAVNLPSRLSPPSGNGYVDNFKNKRRAGYL